MLIIVYLCTQITKKLNHSMQKLSFLLLLVAAVFLGTKALAQPNSVFIYSPDERQGLHVAVEDSTGAWHHLGQLCSSDYGTWGAEKRMYHPSLCRAKDGSWRLVFH